MGLIWQAFGAGDNAALTGHCNAGDYEWCNMQTVRAGQIAVVSDPPAPIGKAFKFEVKYGDVFPGMSDSRSILSGPSSLWEDPDAAPGGAIERWYRWQCFWPLGFVTKYPKWDELWAWPDGAYYNAGSLTEWHHEPYGGGIETGSAPLYFRIDPGKGAAPQDGRFILDLVNKPPNNQDVNRRWDLGPWIRNHWYDVLFHVNWSSDPAKGFVEMWIDGQNVLPYTPTYTSYPNCKIYWISGLYRNFSIGDHGMTWGDGSLVYPNTDGYPGTAYLAGLAVGTDRTSVMYGLTGVTPPPPTPVVTPPPPVVGAPPIISQLPTFQHPSAIFTSADLPTIRNKTTTGQGAVLWNLVRPQLDAHLNDSTMQWLNPSKFQNGDPSYWGKELGTWSLAYMLSGDARYGNRARTMLMQMLSMDWTFGLDPDVPGLNFAHSLSGVCQAYDWCYDILDPGLRQNVQIAIGTGAQTLSNIIADGSAWWAPEVSININWICFAALAQAAIVLQGEDARAATWQAQVVANMDAMAAVPFKHTDGSWHEGISLAQYGFAWSLVGWEAMRLHGAHAADWGIWQGWSKWIAANMLPENIRYPFLNIGDTTYKAVFGDASLASLRYLTFRYRDGTAENIARRIVALGGMPTEGALGSLLSELLAIVWSDDTVTPVDPTISPVLDYYAPDLGTAILTSGWGSNSLRVGVKASPFLGRDIFEDAKNGSTIPVTPPPAPTPVPTVPIPTGTKPFDKIVVVMLENHSFDEIIGSSQAPYINSLVKQGILLNNYHGISHPSEPNYMATYAGSTMGITDDSFHPGQPGPTLGSLLGTNITEYVEGSAEQKHTPWEAFSEGTSRERSFSTFPTNFSTLTKLSFVVPNANDNMHDGTITQCDTWLKNNLDAYRMWAQQNNSLLILWWDEDDTGGDTPIPCVIVGAGVATKTDSNKYDHYSMCKALCNMTGVAPMRNAVNAVAVPIALQAQTPAVVVSATVPSPVPTGPIVTPARNLNVNWGHDHNDDMGFWIYQGAWLAPEATGYMFSRYTEYHNGLLVDGQGYLGDSPRERQVPNGISDSPWQNPWFWDRDATLDSPVTGNRNGVAWAMTRAHGNLLFPSTSFKEVAKDGSKAIQRNPSGITQWERTVLLLRGQCVVLKDSIYSDIPHVYEWLIHGPQAIAADLNTLHLPAPSGLGMVVRIAIPATWDITTAFQSSTDFVSNAPQRALAKVKPRGGAAKSMTFLTVHVPAADGVLNSTIETIIADALEQANAIIPDDGELAPFVPVGRFVARAAGKAKIRVAGKRGVVPDNQHISVSPASMELVTPSPSIPPTAPPIVFDPTVGLHVSQVFPSHEDSAAGRIIEQYKNKQFIAGVVKALANEVTELDNAAMSVLAGYDMRFASGAQLEVIGRIIGEKRKGRSDRAYLNWLKLVVAIGNNVGTPGGVYNLLRLYGITDDIVVREDSVQTFTAILSGRDIPTQYTMADIAMILRAIHPVGSRGLVQFSRAPDAQAFTFGSYVPPSDGTPNSNLLLFPDPFAASWSLTNAVVEGGGVPVGPGSYLRVAKLRENAVTGTHWMQTSQFTQLPPDNAIVSAFASLKAAERKWMVITIVYRDGSLADSVYFDLSLGRIGNIVGSLRPKIFDLGNGWWRCSVTGPAGVGAGTGFTVRYRLGLANGNSSYAGDNFSGVYIANPGIVLGEIDVPTLEAYSGSGAGFSQGYMAGVVE